MFRKIIVNILFIVLFSSFVSAQTAEAEKKEKEAKLKENAVAFLRETASEIVNLRTPENRIGFNAELANLMWFHDEREARVMFNSLTNDFRQMLIQLNGQINAIKFDEENPGIYNIPFVRGASQQAEIYRKFSKAMSVRQAIASAMSEHDALLAYSFFTDTATAITNPKFQEQIKQQDTSFEMKLLQAVAEQNAAKGLELGRKSLANGVNNNHLELLKKIYAKDTDSGAAFGEDIVRKMKSASGVDEINNLYLFSSVLEMGIENRNAIKNKPTQKPMFSDQDLRDLAEIAAQRLQDLEPAAISSYGGFVDNIEKFSPSRAAQIRQKMKTAAASNSNTNSANPQVRAIMEKFEKERLENEEQEKSIEEMATIGTGKLSDQQRTKAISEAQKMIESIDDPTAKITALSGLAAQIAKSGDQELALQFMKQAESFVNNTPKNYLDYMQMWLLASGYAQVNADKSFPILETAIYNLNDTIAAFIKVAEFIDVNGEIIEDGEVQVSGFGGGGITRELIGGLGASEPTIRALSEADFGRMRNLSNKFDRTEVRILAKMLILRAVFDSKSLSENDSKIIETDSLN
ncbi:hypothetical protein BH20ACI4_BH20ACI4_28050 [soil metagenome]